MKTDLKITIKDEECKSLSDCYELFDEKLYQAIKTASEEALQKLLSEFHGIPEDIILKTTTVLR